MLTCRCWMAALLCLPTACIAQQYQRVPPSSSNQGYYTPVQPPPTRTDRPCGHYGMAPCASDTTPADVSIPPGATSDQIFDMGSRAFAQRQWGLASGYFTKAAEMGNTRAQASLGLAYVNQKGEPRDLQKAVYWLTLAANKGHRVAEAQLGDLYEDGDGIEPDLTKAFHYHLASAQQHWWQAEMRLGLEYELGYGTPRSRQTALQWLDRATTDGHDGMSQNLAILLRRSDTPGRFSDLNSLIDYYGRMLGKAQADAMPHFPPGKNCHEHSSTATAYSGHYSAYYCD